MALPEMERGGVAGYIYPSTSTQSVSSDRDWLSAWKRKPGFWYIGRGEAIGVTDVCIEKAVGCMYICESEGDSRWDCWYIIS